ncbi:MAG: N-acetyl-gamma-glutamyl-phosphate reductase [Saprospiraceae bacterium]|nr:N-acetyl-gamma-glutamyl-phosphate reductase [Saprospiraceae bacterium]
MKQVGIVGGGGYTAGELIRILLQHPSVQLKWVKSESQQGKLISDVHQDLIGETLLSFTHELDWNIDVLFLCMGHGRSATFLAENTIPEDILVIDLSRDFRLSSNANPFVYGLPELNRAAIQNSKRIANCGCFATAIQLGLLPLAAEGWLQSDVHIQAITGATGAGQSPAATTHFSWRQNNLSVYKAFQHQHLDEIEQSVHQLQPEFGESLNFIPVRGDFARGIFASMYTKVDASFEQIKEAYSDYYAAAPFTHISANNISLKQVVNTNKCLLYLEKHDDKLLIISVIDNLLKGASGQAVQNMNLALGLKETAGLELKAMVF